MTRTLVLVAMFFLSFNCYAEIIKYATSEKSAGSGNSVGDAADFLNADFWKDVNILLKRESVTVKFLPGDYRRAYLERPLLITAFGNRKNRLVLEGENLKTVFTVPEGSKEKPVLIQLKDSQNITIRNMSFTGNGKLGYALRITSTKEGETKNILIENCRWTDMRGIVYGATGCHQPGTRDVTYKNCVFKRIGIDSHSHHMYHAHGAVRIQVLDSHFEDCTGDYVRFRDNCDFITVKGSTFIRNSNFPVYPFISVPLFNNVDPGDESFSSNYSISENSFKNTRYAIAFHNYGYSFPGFNYLLTEQEGNVLVNGGILERKNLLKNNFGIDVEKIGIAKNQYSDITFKVGMGTFARYGAPSRGFNGWGDISSLFK